MKMAASSLMSLHMCKSNLNTNFAIFNSDVTGYRRTFDSGRRCPQLHKFFTINCKLKHRHARGALGSGDHNTQNYNAQAFGLQRISQNENGDLEFTVRDSNTLPKPLSLSDQSLPVSQGSQLRVAYQGVPGAYSEAAAAKAYPNCEAVPCEQFETAFEAVELWLVDRAVLPIENSLGGSIHRNYDLLLRHRLHIVGEVQFAVHHCLLGVRGVKREELHRVLSHPQALAQCEHTLSKLGVIREAVDDTAGAAQEQ